MTRTNTNADRNERDPKEKERNPGKTVEFSEPMSPTRRGSNALNYPRPPNGTRSYRASLQVQTGAIKSDNWTQEVGTAGAGNISRMNNVATANDTAEDGHLRAAKGRDRTKGHGTLWSRIKEGKSFVDDDYRVSPWLFASDPHGTQMANLICSLDPACELYVAKVTDGNNFGISPERVISVCLCFLLSSALLVSITHCQRHHADDDGLCLDVIGHRVGHV